MNGRGKALSRACNGYLILGSLFGIVHHTFGFGGASLGHPASHGQLWHGFYLAIGLSFLFSVLSKRELGYYWLLTLVLWQIPVETLGAWEAVGALREGSLALSHNALLFQILEPILNVADLVCLWMIRVEFGIVSP